MSDARSACSVEQYIARRIEDLPPDVWHMIPSAFTDAYEALWTSCFKDGDVDAGGGVGRGSNHPMAGRSAVVGRADGSGAIRSRAHSGQQETVGTKVVSGSGRSGGGKVVGKTAATLKDERLFREKTKIDKRLRRMAKEIVGIINESRIKESERRCAGRCRRIGQSDWLYCPNCGSIMEEVN